MAGIPRLILIALLICSVSCGADRDDEVGEGERPKQKGTLDILVDNIPSPAGMTLSPDGSILVASKHDMGGLYVIEPREEGGVDVLRFQTRADLCNPQYVAVDAKGFVYVDTSRRTVFARTRSGRHGGAGDRIDNAGMFRISPDGGTVTRIEGMGDDTLGLALNSEGNLFACCRSTPIAEEEQMGRFAERTADKIFSSSKNKLPYIMQIRATGDSKDDVGMEMVKRIESAASDIAFDSKGDLYLAEDKIVWKMEFGRLGMVGKPKMFVDLSSVVKGGIKTLGIGMDAQDNLLVCVRNPYALAGGSVVKIDPNGKATVFAAGLIVPMDVVADAQGNIFISDKETEKVYYASASAQDVFETPFSAPLPKKVVPKPPKQPRPDKKPSEVTKKVQEAKDGVKPEDGKEPGAGAKEDLVAGENTEELKAELVALKESVSKKEILTFPDTIILRNGRKMRCKIISETSNSVKIETDTGKATMFRKQIAGLEYGTEEDKARASRARSEIAEAQARMDELKSRIAELQPPEETGSARKKGGTRNWPDIILKNIFDPKQSGEYVAILEVDNTRKYVREGKRLDGYEVVSIDAEEECVTIGRSGSREEREFCKE